MKVDLSKDEKESAMRKRERKEEYENEGSSYLLIYCE